MGPAEVAFLSQNWTKACERISPPNPAIGENTAKFVLGGRFVDVSGPNDANDTWWM